MITQRAPLETVTETPDAVVTGPTEKPFVPALIVAFAVIFTLNKPIELLPPAGNPDPPEAADHVGADVLPWLVKT